MAGFEASTVDPAELPALPAGVEFLELPVQVSAPDGVVPVEVSVLLNDVDPASVRLAHLNAVGQWEFIEPFTDGVRVWAITNDFSPVGFVRDVVGSAAGTIWSGTNAAGEFVVNAGDWIADGFTGRSDPPDDCDLGGGDGSTWADHSGSPGNEFVHVCMRNRDDGRVEVAIRSNRGGPVEIMLPDSMSPDWIWIEGTSDWATAVFSSLGSSQNSIVLGPGRDMTIGFSQPLASPEPFEIWTYQTGVAQAWGELADLIGGWSGNELAFIAVTCVAGKAASNGNTDDALGDQVLDCAQNGLPTALEELSKEALDRQLDAAYSRFAEAVDSDSLEWTRRGSEYFEQQFGRYRSDVVKKEGLLKKVGKFFQALNLFRIAADSWTNLLVENFAADEAHLSRVFIAGRCPDLGPVANLTVTGVAEWLNVRSGPDVGTEIVTTIPAGTVVPAFLASLSDQGDRSWVRVWVEEAQQCAWVAADFVKTGDGRLLERPGDYEIAASEMVRRAMLGAEPELLAAETVYDVEDSEGIPMDLAWIEPGLAALYGQPSNLRIRPYLPAQYSATALSPGCAFPSHGVLCFFELVDEASGATVALVETGQYGDGVTGLSVSQIQVVGESDPSRLPAPVAATARRLGELADQADVVGLAAIADSYPDFQPSCCDWWLSNYETWIEEFGSEQAFASALQRALDGEPRRADGYYYWQGTQTGDAFVSIDDAGSWTAGGWLGA